MFWSSVYLGIDALKNIIHGDEINWSSYALRILTGRAVGPFYYIIVLLLLTIISPAFEVVVKNRDKYYIKIIDAILIMITPIYACLIYVLIFNQGDAFSYYTMTVPAWLLFYYLGIRTKAGSSRQSCNIKKCILIASGLVFSVIEVLIYWDQNYDIEFVLSQLKLSSLIYSISLICALCVFWSNHREYKPKRRLGNILVWFGDNSFFIYLSHSLFLVVMNIFLGRLSLPWFAVYSLTFLGVVAFEAICITAIKRLFSGRNVCLLKILGF